jgi:hypothetical protein
VPTPGGTSANQAAGWKRKEARYDTGGSSSICYASLPSALYSVWGDASLYFGSTL